MEEKPMTAEGYVMSELYKSKEREKELEAENIVLRDQVEFMKKMLKPFDFKIRSERYLSAETDLVNLSEFGMENVNKFLEMLK